MRAMIGRAGIDIELLRPSGRSRMLIRVAGPRGSHALCELSPGGAPPAFDLATAIDDADAVLVDGSDVPLQSPQPSARAAAASR